MATIKITDDRQGATFRTGVNGRLYDLPLNAELEVDDAFVDHLKGIGVRFDEVETKRASSSKEGSVEGLARASGPHDVRFPGTANKTVDDRLLAGDQPGDVTSGGAAVAYHDEKILGDTLLEDAEASDKRVVAERAAPKDASVAEKAGEGESGTPVAETQGPEPTHKASPEEKKAEAAAAKAAKANDKK